MFSPLIPNSQVIFNEYSLPLPCIFFVCYGNYVILIRFAMKTKPNWTAVVVYCGVYFLQTSSRVAALFTSQMKTLSDVELLVNQTLPCLQKLCFTHLKVVSHHNGCAPKPQSDARDKRDCGIELQSIATSKATTAHEHSLLSVMQVCSLPQALKAFQTEIEVKMLSLSHTQNMVGVQTIESMLTVVLLGCVHLQSVLNSVGRFPCLQGSIMFTVKMKKLVCLLKSTSNSILHSEHMEFELHKLTVYSYLKVFSAIEIQHGEDFIDVTHSVCFPSGHTHIVCIVCLCFPKN